MFFHEVLKKIFLHIFGFGALVIFFVFSENVVLAAPTAPNVVTLSQPDGTSFEAIAWGDEWLNGMETLDGYTIEIQPEDEFWVYAQPDNKDRDSTLTKESKSLIVGHDDPSDLPKHFRPSISNELHHENPLVGSNRSIQSSDRVADVQPILLLLVEYENSRSQTTEGEWYEKLFSPTGSVGHYYYEASFGRLTLEPAMEESGTPNNGVVGWLNLGDAHPNPAKNVGSTNLDIVRKAILASDPSVNYSYYDTNSDGYISYEELHIMVVVAGYEYAYGGAVTCSPSVYAHQYYLDYVYVDAPTVDGVKVASYQGGGGYTEFGEMHCEIGEENPHPATIGIIAHELGHDLQWPDLYDTFNPNSMDEADTPGIGNWGLMGYGMWNRSVPNAPFYGDSPAYPTAWSRLYQGWLDPVHITASTLNISIPPIVDSGVVYQLRENPNGVDWVWYERSGIGEYFLIENRQPIGYDVGLPGFGLLIWRIDESVIYNNFANSDQNHRLVDLIQADGLRQLNITSENRGDMGDPYPGVTQNTHFNANSNPNSNLYSGFPSGVSVTGITPVDRVINSHLFVSSFLDVLPNQWFWNPIETIYASGITNGRAPGLFYPQEGTNRAELAVFFGRAIYGTKDPPPDDEVMNENGKIVVVVEEVGETVSFFDDVPASFWASAWIEKLHTDGLLKGVSTDPPLYDPLGSLTRAQMAALLVRYLYGEETELPDYQGVFVDVEKGHWAASAIEQLYAIGITQGCESSPELKFCPDETVSRAEMAAFLKRTFNFPSP